MLTSSSVRLIQNKFQCMFKDERKRRFLIKLIQGLFSLLRCFILVLILHSWFLKPSLQCLPPLSQLLATSLCFWNFHLEFEFFADFNLFLVFALSFVMITVMVSISRIVKYNQFVIQLDSYSKVRKSSHWSLNFFSCSFPYPFLLDFKTP